MPVVLLTVVLAGGGVLVVELVEVCPVVVVVFVVVDVAVDDEVVVDVRVVVADLVAVVVRGAVLVAVRVAVLVDLLVELELPLVTVGAPLAPSSTVGRVVGMRLTLGTVRPGCAAPSV